MWVSTLGYYCHQVSNRNGVNYVRLAKHNEKDIDWRDVINGSIELAKPNPQASHLRNRLI